MTELSEKLAFRHEFARHLGELSLLLGRAVRGDELMSVDETKTVRAQANEVVRQPTLRFELPFADKAEQRFAEFVQRLTRANPSDVYPWTPASNVCGVLRPIPMKVINMAFPFDLNPEGIIVILTADLRDQLLLDYSYGNNDEQHLEVEVSGEHWGQINY